MEISCPYCGASAGVEDVFCPTCRKRLIPLTPYDITIEDYIYPPDMDGIESLEELKPLTRLTEHFILKKYVKEVTKNLSQNAVKVQYGSKLDSIIRKCAIILGLEVMPEVFIIPSNTPNAFTLGPNENPVLGISSTILKILDEPELKAIIGHELGHIKSKHMPYHTLAELLTEGIDISSRIIGLDLISPFIKLLLLSWHRESEISADRASLLVINDPKVIESALAKIIITANPIHYNKIASGKENVVDLISELFQTHPNYSNRVKMVREYYRSRKYWEVKRKLEKRIMFSKALTLRCRFCGARKSVLDLFCPICGKSQV